MKYLQLFESWNPLSDTDLASAQELHSIGVVSDKELIELTRLNTAHQKIFQYKGVGDLNLSYTYNLTGLPNGLKVGGHLTLNGCKGLESLPDDLAVKGYLDLHGCISLKSLPSGLKVGRNLYLYGCTGLESLPQDLKVGGQIYR